MQSNDAPHWINPPPFHEIRGDELIVRTGRDTDWWNNTFYGFKHLSGHFLAHQMTGDFSLEATFSAGYRRLYDQAGVMLRVDDSNWLKTGTEFTDGALHFSVVVTRDDQSDWSVLKLGGDIGHPVAVRLTRHAEALRVQRRGADGVWQLVRLAYLKMPETVEVGPMCCSPTGEGLEVTFSHVSFGSPISRELHED
jgi:regulation of enolase protein 1 (concanavalin A-like superfamily)